MEWKEVNLSKISDIQTGPFGSQLHNEDYVKKGTPIVTVEHLGKKSFTTQNLPCVSDTDKARLSKYISKKGDIIYSRVGSVDRCSYVDDSTDGWLFSGRCLRVRLNLDFDSEFVYYYLNTENVKLFIRNIAVGATMPSINTKLLGEVPVRYPSKTIQRRIASILSSLDRKIELNNKINAQLEEMAQAIFKSWFVGFEPFKDGKFVESELGMIPEGWRVGKLEEAIEIKYGKDHKKLLDGNIPVYGSGGLMRRVNSILYQGESVLIPRKGTLNNIMYVNEEFWTVDTMFFSIPKIEKVMKYIYLFLKRFDFEKMNEGTSIPSTTTARLNSLDILIPSIDVLDKFDKILSSLYKTKNRLQTESLHLAHLRDTLLPKLMNGEIEI